MAHHYTLAAEASTRQEHGEDGAGNGTGRQPPSSFFLLPLLPPSSPPSSSFCTGRSAGQRSAGPGAVLFAGRGGGKRGRTRLDANQRRGGSGRGLMPASGQRACSGGAGRGAKAARAGAAAVRAAQAARVGAAAARAAGQRAPAAPGTGAAARRRLHRVWPAWAGRGPI